MGKLQRRLDQRLTLWVRQLAWWQATPKPDPRSKRARSEEVEQRVSRAETARLRKSKPRMPPNPAPHLTDWLDELGITEAGGMAAVPLSWREIQAWHDSLHLRLEPWEKRLLRKLSKAYINESREAESEHRPPPWRAGVTVEQQAADLADLRALFS